LGQISGEPLIEQRRIEVIPITAKNAFFGWVVRACRVIQESVGSVFDGALTYVVFSDVQCLVLACSAGVLSVW